MVARSQGTASDVFVVQGSGFAPGAPVTFSLSGVGPPPDHADLLNTTSPYHAAVGRDGTFRVPVSRLYSGPLQLGEYTVRASASGSSGASTQFMVIPDGPPSGGGPPAGG